MFKYLKFIGIIAIICSFGFNNNYQMPTDEQWRQIHNEVAKLIWEEAMNAKNHVNQAAPQIR